MVNLLIGIVTFKSRDIIAKCVNAVMNSAREIDHKIVICDNASFDGTPQMISQNFGNIDLIASSENLGYARGINEIAKSHDWKYLLVLNPDVVVQENTISLALEFIEEEEETSLVGANLIDSNGIPVHSWGELPTPSMFKFDFSGLRKWFPRSKWSTTKSVTIEKVPFEAGYVTGAFMLIARHAWDSIGPFDDRFFLFFEDTDWSLRLHKANRKAYVHPDVKAIHESGSSFGGDETAREYKMKCFFESAYKYFGKHFGEVERDITFDRVVAMAKLKLFILKLKKEDKIEAIARQRMIIKIHKELAKSVFKR